MRQCKTVILSLCCFMLAANGWAEQFVFHHENVLGTSLELRLDCDSEATANNAEQAVLAEIDRLDQMLSSYRSDSEFGRFLALAPGESMQASRELLELLKRCEAWQQTSRGAFHPGIVSLANHWQEAAQLNRIPTQSEVQQWASELRVANWQVDMQHQTVTRCTAQPLTLNAIAKGTILDAAARSLQNADDWGKKLSGATINIGGDLCTIGSLHQVVGIPHPRHDAMGADLLAQIQLNNAAIATSGTSERHYTINGNQYSHILNPITGQPANAILSASVIAQDAETADVLATICSVLAPQDSLQLVQSLPGVACMLITNSGVTICSPSWPAQESQSKENNPSQDGADSKQEQEEEIQTPHDFHLEFEIAKSSQGGRYRRPYVAAWIEDEEGFPVKTLSLFLMTNNPGPRWHRDLRRWYPGDQMRLAVDEDKLIGTISKPTRNPGVYRVAWNGTDDHGKLLTEGKYTLLIEAAREHGTYQLMRHSFEFGKSDFEETLKGNAEISEASFSYKFKTEEKPEQSSK